MKKVFIIIRKQETSTNSVRKHIRSNERKKIDLRTSDRTFRELSTIMQMCRVLRWLVAIKIMINIIKAWILCLVFEYVLVCSSSTRIKMRDKI